jgi:hypothetical protein
MAVIRSAVVARGRKKIGDIVLKRRLGQTIVAQRQLVVKNPKTTKQVAQRAKFAIAIGIAILAKFIVKTIFPFQTYRGTRMNKLTQFLLKRIVETAYPLVTFTGFNASKVGNGDGFNVIPVTVTPHAGKSLNVTWNPLVFPTGAPVNGTMSILAICTTHKQVAFEQSIIPFSAGVASFFSVSTPFAPGDKVMIALSQTYTTPDGKVHQSEFQFETIAANYTIIA